MSARRRSILEALRVTPAAFLRQESPLAKAPATGTLINLDKDAAGGDAAIKGVQAALKGKTIGVQVSTTHANFASQNIKDVARCEGIQDRRRPRP